MGLGLPELLVILVIVFLIFGAGKLPDVMAKLGEGVQAFREGASGESEAEAPKMLANKAPSKASSKSQTKAQTKGQTKTAPKPAAKVAAKSGPKAAVKASAKPLAKPKKKA